MRNIIEQLLIIVAMALAACALAIGREVPLPRAKPLLSPATSQSASLSVPAAPVPQVLPLHNAKAWPSDCALRLAGIARFSHQPTLNGPGQCGAGDIVQLETVILPDGTLVAVLPPATLRCPMAEAVSHWVRSDLRAAITELDSSIAAVTSITSYDCRTRNNVAGAKISEHGRGNAIDLGPIRLRNGTMVDLTKKSTPQSFRQRLKDATCQRFKTVLGPGSDAYHVDHIHVDLAERARGYRMCQWDVRDLGPVAEVPIPLPKPVALQSQTMSCQSTGPKRRCLR